MGDARIMAATDPDLLQTIVAATRRIVDVRSQRVPLERMDVIARRAGPRGVLWETALARQDRYNVIAECKRRSPSRGVLKTDYDAARLAHAYEGAGAAAISVLTEPTFFDGSLEHLRQVREATRLPLLRKDFIVTPYQVFESAASGADAILLIVAALADDELRALLILAHELGLGTLVEVHDAMELDRAIAAGTRLVGVNNRNLRTLAVDRGASEQLAARIPDELMAVAESGIRHADDLRALRALKYDAFLVGESLLTQPDPGDALAELLARADGRWPMAEDCREETAEADTVRKPS
ncbi:MAG: indole-3-glycerol phosphate synthase TrpC [Acidobacteria bacterium]|nr:indole-3-glycerol phosphate synthase TrpC [Acidobacteriota bacterium]